VTSNEKNAKLGQKGHVGVTYPHLEFWDPPNISRVEARNFKFGKENNDGEF